MSWGHGRPSAESTGLMHHSRGQWTPPTWSMLLRVTVRHSALLPLTAASLTVWQHDDYQLAVSQGAAWNGLPSGDIYESNLYKWFGQMDVGNLYFS